MWDLLEFLSEFVDLLNWWRLSLCVFGAVAVISIAEWKLPPSRVRSFAAGTLAAAGVAGGVVWEWRTSRRNKTW